MVTLDRAEFVYAACRGVERQVDNVLAGRHDRYGGQQVEPYRAHVEGACGEYAVALYMGQPWDGALGNLRAADVGPTVQVRAGLEDHYRLILHPSDPDDHAFILVTGRAPRLTIRGWLLGREGKQQCWWQDPKGSRPAYFVPQSALQPISRAV